MTAVAQPVEVVGAWKQRAALVVPEEAMWFFLGGAGVGSGAMIVAASLGARRAGRTAGWASSASLLAGIVAFATAAFVGAYAWLLWIGVASIAMLVPRPRTTP